MIKQFEQMARACPHDIFFQYVDQDGECESLSYEKVKRHAVTLALRLGERGIARGSCIAVDLPNCPAFVVLALAAAYGGFAIVALNHRLTDDEKRERLLDLRMAGVSQVASAFDEPTLWNLIKQPPKSAGELSHFAGRAGATFDQNARALVLFTSGTTGRPKAVALTWKNLLCAAEASNASLNTPGQGLWQASLPLFHVGGFQILVRSVLNGTPFILYRHFDARRVLFDAREFGVTHISVVDKMLQEMLDVEAAEAKAFGSVSRDSVDARAAGSVSCLAHTTGDEGNRRDNDDARFADVNDSGRPEYGSRCGALDQYRCLLLGGAALNPATVKRSVVARARVYASYGMTETSSQIASSLLTRSFKGGLVPLAGYEVQIVNPDEKGVGQLAVKGPGVFGGYLNARTALTADGFFLTGDSASLVGGKLHVRERTGDMFISGGENVYPAEIQSKLLHVPQVRDAYVFGINDEVWGKRPVAFVERERLAAMQGKTPQQFAVEVYKSLEQRLSKLYLPQHICVLDEFPRTGVGKVDRAALQTRFDECLDVRRITLYRIDQKFTVPVTTAKTTLYSRESIIVEVEDWAGRTGLGECVAFPTDWYLPETLGQDLRVLEDHLIPLVLDQVYLHPSEVSACFDECVPARGFPLAQGALEPALWDLYGKIMGQPLWQLIGGESSLSDHAASRTGQSKRPFAATAKAPVPAKTQASASFGLTESSAMTVADESIAVDLPGRSAATTAVPAGAVVGIISESKTLEEVGRLVAAGYNRVKLKIKPGDDLARVVSVRGAFPQLTIMLDANQSYAGGDREILMALDGFNITCIEEPLNPHTFEPGGAPSNLTGSITLPCDSRMLLRGEDASNLTESITLPCDPHAPLRMDEASSPADSTALPRGSRAISHGGKAEFFKRLARLQQSLQTPICLDESVVTPEDFMSALEYPELSCFALKIAKLGGVQKALDFYNETQKRGLEVWMGGMYDTAISKRLHAAFEMLPGINIPGDLSEATRYFERDITNPPFTVEGGWVVLNPKNFEAGLGCDLDREALKRVLVEQRDYFSDL